MRRYNLNLSGGGAGWDHGHNFGARDHFEDSRSSVKRDAGRARQIGPQNLDGRSHLAGGRLCFHKRPQAYRQVEDRAIEVGPASPRCPVEGPVGVLDQRRFGVFAVRATDFGAKAVKRRQRATWGDFEDRSIAVGPARRRCPVEASASR